MSAPCQPRPFQGNVPTIRFSLPCCSHFGLAHEEPHLTLKPRRGSSCASGANLGVPRPLPPPPPQPPHGQPGSLTGLNTAQLGSGHSFPHHPSAAFRCLRTLHSSLIDLVKPTTLRARSCPAKNFLGRLSSPSDKAPTAPILPPGMKATFGGGTFLRNARHSPSLSCFGHDERSLPFSASGPC